MVLPGNEYGENAVSRGDEHTRFITLRNLTWKTTTCEIKLSDAIGLVDNGGLVTIKQYHPTEKLPGIKKYGGAIQVEVLPFRACLIKVTNNMADDELGISGCDYEIISDKPDSPTEIRLLGWPGEQKTIRLTGDYGLFKSASIANKEDLRLVNGQTKSISFPGVPLKGSYHRKIGRLETCAIPEDVFSLYEATQFAADNNALEVRSLKRSGPTSIPAVKAARAAFFNQSMFVRRDTWDRYLFDGDESTSFSISTRYLSHHPLRCALRIDLGEVVRLDSLIIKVADEFSLQPYKSDEGEYIQFSRNLKDWESIKFITGTKMKIELEAAGPVRYLSFPYSMLRIREIEGYREGAFVDRTLWRASNLQRPYVFSWHWDETQHYNAQKAWKCTFQLPEIAKGSYLCVAINGVHGVEGALASFKIDGNYVGCPDRSPSYKSNTWEYRVLQSDRNYTYYLPLTSDMIGKSIEAYVLAFNKKHLDLKPEIWITAHPIPYEEVRLTLE